MLLPSASAADELSEFSERLTLNILAGQPGFGERIDRMIREKLTAFRLEQMAAGTNSQELDQRLKEKYEELTRDDTLRQVFWKRALDVTEAAQKICQAVFVLWRVRGKTSLAKFDGASVSYRERYQARSGADIKSVEVTIADNRGFSTEGQPSSWDLKPEPYVIILQFTPQDLFKVQQGLCELNNPTFSPTTEELRLLNRLWTLADQFQQRLRKIPQELLELAGRGNKPGVYHLRLFTKAFYWMPVNWEGTYQEVLIPSTGEAPSREVRNLCKTANTVTGSDGA
jgi:hypothetical protein